MLTVRPKVAELVLQLYGRPLHPELFEAYSSRDIKRGDYEARVQITGAGHVVTWRYAGLTLTEVATSAHHPLPKRRRLLSYRLKGQRSDYVECRGGLLSVNQNVAPWPRPSDSTQTLPPWTSTIRLTRASPTPLPSHEGSNWLKSRKIRS